jgi:hypothetical protein
MCGLTLDAPQIGSPENNTRHGSSTITVSGIARPEATVEIEVNDSFIFTTTANAATGYWEKLVSLQQGPNIITAVAKQNGQTSPESDPVTVHYDTGPPLTTITDPPSDNLWLRGTYPFRGHTTDDVAGTTLQYRIDSGNWITAIQNQATSFDWQIEVDTTALSDGGPHSFQARGLDLAGYVETERSRSFRVDNQLPAATISATTFYTLT